MDKIVILHGITILDCGPDPVVTNDRESRDLVGNALVNRAAWASVPMARLAPDFFRLSSGLAGEVVQKFANYDIGLAVMGDISGHLSRSEPLREFVREANRGAQLWFLPDRAAFENKLER